jgi:hypothetical protein
MATLQDLGLTLGNVDLGEIEAEADPKLAEYFVTTDFVVDAIEGTASLFLGRKGSGKSAVFTQLPRLIRESGKPEVISIQLTPDNYSWAALRRYEEQGLLAEHAHTNAWKYSLVIEIAANLVGSGHAWSPAAEKGISELKSFLGANYGPGQSTFGTSATSLIKGLQNLNLSAFGFGVGVERAAPAEVPITPAVTRALLERMDEAFKEASVVVVLDRLDDSWDASPESHSLLVGLLKAARDLTNTYGNRGPTGLRVLTFLRSDIYDNLRFDDKDKQRGTERLLTWSAAQLGTMLTLRLPTGMSADELFEQGDPMRGGITPFNYIVKRTFLRPREILQFTGLCIQQAGKASTVVSKENIRQAEERYSSWKVDDLKQEYRKATPHFERLVECLREGVHRYDAIDDLNAVIASKEPGIVEDLGTRRVLEILFEASVIGVRARDSGSLRFRSEDSNLILPAAGAVYVHQGLYKGLRIHEARA